MSPTFLGRPIRSANQKAAKAGFSASALRLSRIGLLAGSLGFLVLAGVTATFKPVAAPVAAFEPAPVISRVFPLNLEPVHASDSAPSPDLCAGIQVPTSPLFPFIPDTIVGDATHCNPTYWNIGIIGGLAQKVIYILNWVALVLAVCMTIYAGLLYISGFANEANVKKAKSLLIICYTGLIIVFSARIILLGFANLFSSDQNTTNTINTTLSK